ncbi:MAG: tannase/feruloyl esterase family alpha/beta hydrolase, partial [Croceibacterium sp.]
RSVRLFMVPGMYHCRGGPGADNFGGSGQQNTPGDPQRDMLWALIRWVEEERAPDRIVAAKLGPQGTALTRALCPFPQSARYDGKRPASAAASYSCVSDPLLTAALARTPLPDRGALQ